MLTSLPSRNRSSYSTPQPRRQPLLTCAKPHHASAERFSARIQLQTWLFLRSCLVVHLHSLCAFLIQLGYISHCCSGVTGSAHLLQCFPLLGIGGCGSCPKRIVPIRLL